MLNKRFSERLNTALDNIEASEITSERIEILSKLIKVHKFKAEALLNGNMSPDNALLTILAQELDVNAEWLIGKNDAISDTH